MFMMQSESIQYIRGRNETCFPKLSVSATKDLLTAEDQ